MNTLSIILLVYSVLATLFIFGMRYYHKKTFQERLKKILYPYLHKMENEVSALKEEFKVLNSDETKHSLVSRLQFRMKLNKTKHELNTKKAHGLSTSNKRNYANDGGPLSPSSVSYYGSGGSSSSNSSDSCGGGGFSDSGSGCA